MTTDRKIDMAEPEELLPAHRVCAREVIAWANSLKDRPSGTAIADLIRTLATAIESDRYAALVSPAVTAPVAQWQRKMQDGSGRWGNLDPDEDVEQWKRMGYEVRALYVLPIASAGEPDHFLTAFASKDGKVTGIDHETCAAWNDVRTAHVALRDWLNERIANEDKCPFFPCASAGEAGWRTMDSAKKVDGTILIGWGEYRERDGFSPAFMRWYDSVGGWSVNAMPFYPTHWMPLPVPPTGPKPCV